MYQGLIQHRDIGRCILPFLTPVSYMAICQALPLAFPRTHFPSIHEFTGKTIERRLKETCPVAADEIIKSLADHWLTGGFLLACLNGDPIHPASDIDLIHPPTNGFHVALVDRYYANDAVAYVTERPIDGEHKLQFIATDDLRLLLATYDLPICANTFHQGRLYCADFNAVCTRTCKLNAESALSSLCRRPCDMDGLELDEQVTIRVARIKKYRSRGYTIIPRDIIRNVSQYDNIMFQHTDSAETCLVGRAKHKRIKLDDDVLQFCVDERIHLLKSFWAVLYNTKIIPACK
jgi:hypothetical protein